MAELLERLVKCTVNVATQLAAVERISYYSQLQPETHSLVRLICAPCPASVAGTGPGRMRRGGHGTRGAPGRTPFGNEGSVTETRSGGRTALEQPPRHENRRHEGSAGSGCIFPCLPLPSPVEGRAVRRVVTPQRTLPHGPKPLEWSDGVPRGSQ